MYRWEKVKRSKTGTGGKEEAADWTGCHTCVTEGDEAERKTEDEGIYIKKNKNPGDFKFKSSVDVKDGQSANIQKSHLYKMRWN